MKTEIFIAKTEIARALKLGIGIQSAKDNQLIRLDAESEKFTQKIERTFKVEREG